MRFINLIKSVSVEALIVFALILTYNNYLGNEEVIIKADGKGYYDYLPSVFIFHDLDRKNHNRFENHQVYERVNKLSVYVPYGKFLVNKYPVGTSLMISPFFFITYAIDRTQGEEVNVFSRPFNISIFHAAVFYLFLSLFFLKKLLKLYDFKYFTILIIQLLLIFATAVPLYSSYDAAFSHIYSLFAITTFLYCLKYYFSKLEKRYILYCMIMLGLIVLIRPFNILVVLFIPFIAGSFEQLKSGINGMIKSPVYFFSGIAIFLLIVSIQLMAWYLQTGTFLLYSYQNEGFNLNSPQIINVLFSYRKGLFIYTPVLLLSFAGLIKLFLEKKYYLFISWLMFFVLITYFISSWWCWYYGGSYGMRPYIDYYVIFFIPFAYFLDKVSLWIKTPFVLLAMLTIPLNLIQIKQFKKYILHYSEMDKDKYWKVFLKEDDEYKGLLWKKTYNYNSYKKVLLYQDDNVTIPANTTMEIFKSVGNQVDSLHNISIIQVNLVSMFEEDEKARMILTINDTISGGAVYYLNPPLIHFDDGQLGTTQHGHYDYEFKPIPSMNTNVIKLKCEAKSHDILLNDISIFALIQK